MNDLQYIRSVIDKYLEWYDEIGNISDKMLVPKIMIEKNHEEWEDSVYWKPTESILDNYDFEYVENRLMLQIPKEYKHILSYKHFLEIGLGNVILFKVLPTWKTDYLNEISNYQIDFAKNKIFPIGAYSDYGITCIEIETNNIIWLDQERDYKLKHKQKIANNLIELFKEAEKELVVWKSNV